MPLFFLLIGILFVVTGINNTTADMFKLIRGEFSGQRSFVPWLLSIVIVGSIGFVDGLKSVSNAFLGLLCLVLVLSNEGFFNKFNAAFASGSSKSNASSSSVGDAVDKVSNGVNSFQTVLDNFSSSLSRSSVVLNIFD